MYAGSQELPIPMNLRVILPILALATPAVAQPGLYAPSTTHIKAGDRAPDITFTRLLNAPTAGSWSQANLTGQLTVLLFMPNTSRQPPDRHHLECNG